MANISYDKPFEKDQPYMFKYNGSEVENALYQYSLSQGGYRVFNVDGKNQQYTNSMISDIRSLYNMENISYDKPFEKDQPYRFKYDELEVDNALYQYSLSQGGYRVFNVDGKNKQYTNSMISDVQSASTSGGGIKNGISLPISKRKTGRKIIKKINKRRNKKSTFRKRSK